MASTFKTFTNSDLTNNRSLMHEAIPITGSLLSGSYGSNVTVTGSEPHIKAYSHGMFQSIYDYPHVSSSANHLFDMTFGFKTGSFASGVYTAGNSSVDTQGEKKLNVYNQLSQILVGYDESGDLRKFDKDGNFATALSDQSDKIGDVVALCFSRLLVKDEIKKGSFSLKLGVDRLMTSVWDTVINITDDGASTNFRSNSPAGEYGFLKATSITTDALAAGLTDAQKTVGLIYYQAGVVVLDFSKILSKPTQPADHATATFTFSDKPNETTTITLTDAADTTVIFEIDADANGGAGSNVELDGIVAAGGGAAGTAIDLVAKINAHAFNITAARSGNKVTLTQDTAGSSGTKAITSTLTTGAFSVAVPAAFTIDATFDDRDGILHAETCDLESHDSVFLTHPAAGGNQTVATAVDTHTIDKICNGFRSRIKSINFNNTTELNSTVYFCRMNHNEFNYSSNPTYLSGSQLRVKEQKSDMPRSYVTTIGLYSADNELLATAKLSEPLRKDPTNELFLRVRLDY